MAEPSPVPPPGTAVPPPGTAAPVPVAPPRHGAVWRGVVLGIVFAISAIAGTILLTILGFEIGPQALAVGIAAAVLPVPLLILVFLWLDRYAPEPILYLAACFIWGAFFATTVSYFVNNGGSVLFEQLGLPDDLVAVLVAPFIEELMKALGPLIILLLRRREFSGVTDGIVYCGLSATGFAMVENILYLGGHGWASGVAQYGPATAAQQVIALFMVRIMLSGFAHPLFTAMTGIGLGIAARTASGWVRWLAPLAGLLVAMMLHGGWNLMSVLTQATGEAVIMLYGYVAVMVPIFLAMVGVALWLRSWEGRLTERVLPLYARLGWLSPPEVAALGTLGRRYSARRWARRVAGEAGVRAMRAYQIAATRLALLRDGMDRGLDRTPAEVARSAQEERGLLDAMAAARRAFVGRDPQAPPAIWDGARYHLTFPDGTRRAVDPPPEPVAPVPVVLGPPPPAASAWGYR